MNTHLAGAGDADPSGDLGEHALRLAADLIRIDTTNTGDPETTVGEFRAELEQLLGGPPGVEVDGVTWELETLPGFETTGADSLLTDVTAALRNEDPEAVVLPFLMPASTDAKTFHGLGIQCLGFTPTRMPADLDYLALFHAVDERVPVDALGFGARVLERLLLGGDRDR